MRLYPDATNRFVEDPAANLRTPASKQGYSKTLRLLHFAYPDLRVGDFTEQTLAEFCGRPELAPASQQAYKTRIQGFFSWAKWRGIIPEDPASNLGRLVKGSTHKGVRQHHWLTEAEVTRILESVDQSTIVGRRSHLVARLGFTAGLRRAEIAQLSWSQVDLPRNQVHLTGKGNKRATVYLTSRTAGALEKWRVEATEGLGHDPRAEPVIPRFQWIADWVGGGQVMTVQWDRPLTPQAIGLVVRELSASSGVSFTAHDMRRTFAGILEDKGMPIEQISAALRHSDIGTTQRYLQQRQDAAYQAVRDIGLDI